MLLKRGVLATILSAVMLSAGYGAATASGDCDIDYQTGKCAVAASGRVYVPPGAVFRSGSHRKAGRPICFDKNIPEGEQRYIVACDGGNAGWWSNSLGCWVALAAVQPPKSDPVWEGHDDGAIYTCQPATGDVTVGVPPLRDVWLAAPPPQLVDPELVAFRALELMALHRAGIGTTPAAGRTGVVGLPTYLWVTDPGPSVTGPQTRTASAGAVSVTGTATVVKMEWSLGNGRTIVCSGPGTPYRDSFGSRPSPTCGHTYTRPGAYAVSLTTHWRFEWAGAGQSGSYEFTFTTPTAFRMQEVQALT